MGGAQGTQGGTHPHLNLPTFPSGIIPLIGLISTFIKPFGATNFKVLTMGMPTNREKNTSLLPQDAQRIDDESVSPAGSWYCSSEVFSLEKNRLFDKEWVPLTPVGAIPEPFLGMELDHLGHCLHVRKDAEKGWVVLSRVCRHRGALVQSKSLGNQTCFVCPYHGWTYDGLGKRVFCPEWPGAASQDYPGLMTWDCREWAGFLWVKMDHGSSQESSRDVVKGNLGLPGEFDLGELSWSGTWWDEMDCDWKVFTDNYLDGGYHLGPVHPELAGALNAQSYKTVVFDRAVLQWTPSRDGGGVMADIRSGGEARYWWIWPNFFWNHYGDYLDTNVVYPAGPGRCRVRFDFFFAPKGRFATSDQRTKSIDAARLIQDQDRVVCESVQFGMRSGEFQGGPYHPIRENGMRHFHQLWRESLGSLRNAP